MICSILAHGHTLRQCNNLPIKQCTINVLGVMSTYRAINIRKGELADIGKVTPFMYLNSLS
jgi:hypothetical protein